MHRKLRWNKINKVSINKLLPKIFKIRYLRTHLWFKNTFEMICVLKKNRLENEINPFHIIFCGISSKNDQRLCKNCHNFRESLKLDISVTKQYFINPLKTVCAIYKRNKHAIFCGICINSFWDRQAFTKLALIKIIYLRFHSLRALVVRTLKGES